MQAFEVYLQKEKLSREDWQKLLFGIAQYIGFAKSFKLAFTFKDNVVRIFIFAPKDIGVISNNLEGIVLRPTDEQDLLPEVKRVNLLHFMRFVTGGNILDLREKYQVKKAKELDFAIFRIRAVNVDKQFVNGKFYFEGVAGNYYLATKRFLKLPMHLFEIDFGANTRYLKKKVGKYLNIEKSLHILTSDENSAVFKVNTFPYMSRPYYLNLNSYEFDKHSFIIGASGSGKSKLISIFVDRLARSPLSSNYRVVVIDPHASLSEDFEHIKKHTIINFHKNEGTDLFPGAAADITAAVELTATLFKSLLAEQFNARLDRLLRFSLFVLLTAQIMSLNTLKRFITEIEYRNQILDHVGGYIPQNIVQFFGADFNEIRTKYYNEAITPIISLVEEMQLQPSLVGESQTSLAKTIQDNFLTVFSLNKVSMGDKVVKTVAGLLIQQIFLLAQARIFSEKVILIVDEVSVVQNPALASILAEARKFNLSVILTQQYFGQIEKDLQDAIFANVYNYYAFKVSEEDARSLEGNLNMELPAEITKSEHKKGVKESEVRIKMMTELHPRECLVRVVAGGQIIPCFKTKTVDAPLSSSQDELKDVKLREVKPNALPTKFVESTHDPIAPVIDSKQSGLIDGSEQEAVVNSYVQPQSELETQVERDTVGSNTSNDELIPMQQAAISSHLTGIPDTSRGISLSELLAQHSSSRINVNNRKEEK